MVLVGVGNEASVPVGSGVGKGPVGAGVVSVAELSGGKESVASGSEDDVAVLSGSNVSVADGSGNGVALLSGSEESVADGSVVHESVGATELEL